MAVLWKNLAAGLEAQIEAGEWKPGDELPSEAELAKLHGVSRNTVRLALGDLERRGLVVGSPGQRRVVAARVLLDIHVTRPASRVIGGQGETPGADSWRSDVTILGHKAGEHLSVWAAEAGDMSGRLGLGRRDAVVVRELVRTAGDRPHNLVAWWFPRWLAAGTKLVMPDDIEQGSIPYLGGIGHRPYVFTVEIETRMPTLHEMGRLAIPHGVPVMVEYRTGATSRVDGKIVFSSVTLWPGDRTRLVLDL